MTIQMVIDIAHLSLFTFLKVAGPMLISSMVVGISSNWKRAKEVVFNHERGIMASRVTIEEMGKILWDKYYSNTVVIQRAKNLKRRRQNAKNRTRRREREI